MSVRFFCKGCRKEIWKEMPQYKKETMTIAKAAIRARCSDCMIEEERKDNNQK